MLTSIVASLLLTQVAPWGTPAIFNPHGQSIAAQDPLGNTAPFHVDALGNLLVSGAGGGGGLTDAQLRASPVPVSGTLGVTGTFWPATQPVSAVALPLPSGAAQDRTTAAAPLACRLTDGASFYTAGGSSGLTDAQLRAAPVPMSLATAPTTPVTGTFWQAIQPISATSLPLPTNAATDRTTAAGPSAVRLSDGAAFLSTLPVSLATAPTTPVTGTFWQATQPVSGAFWQATQPVSLASAPTTPVTGTFWQATQPVSGTVTVASTSANQGTAAATSGAWPVKMTDGTNVATVKAASTAPVAADPAIVFAKSPNGGNPCQNSSATLLAVSGSTSGTAAVQIIAASGSAKVYICSMTIVGASGTTPTFSLVYGTGTNCGTGQTVIIGPWTTAANTLYQFSTPVFVTPASQAVCYLDTGTTPIQRYAITYVQQ